jgi:Zn-dependent protease
MMLPGVLMGLTFHEFAHAWVATRFGDDTPRLMGRVTLNPMAHLDILGTLLLFIGGFGWAKPVQVNTSRLRPRVWGDIAVSLAGVTMNLLLSIIFFILLNMAAAGLFFGYRNLQLLLTLQFAYRINLILVGFNLIPLPPLDGFHVARYLLPPSMNQVVSFLYQWGPYLFFFLVIAAPQVLHLFLDPVYAGLLFVVRGVSAPVFWALGI